MVVTFHADRISDGLENNFVFRCLLAFGFSHFLNLKLMPQSKPDATANYHKLITHAHGNTPKHFFVYNL